LGNASVRRRLAPPGVFDMRHPRSDRSPSARPSQGSSASRSTTPVDVAAHWFAASSSPFSRPRGSPSTGLPVTRRSERLPQAWTPSQGLRHLPFRSRWTDLKDQNPDPIPKDQIPDPVPKDQIPSRSRRTGPWPVPEGPDHWSAPPGSFRPVRVPKDPPDQDRFPKDPPGETGVPLLGLSRPFNALDNRVRFTRVCLTRHVPSSEFLTPSTVYSPVVPRPRGPLSFLGFVRPAHRTRVASSPDAPQ